MAKKRTQKPFYGKMQQRLEARGTRIMQYAMRATFAEEAKALRDQAGALFGMVSAQLRGKELDHATKMLQRGVPLSDKIKRYIGYEDAPA